MSQVKMTNYEINKQAYLNFPKPSEEELGLLLNNPGGWFSTKMDKKYFMLLCRERNDYTLIHVNNYNFDAAVQEIKEILESRGDILDIQFVHGEDCYQCWVRERYTDSIRELEEQGPNKFKWTPQVWMYMLFEAEDFVIEAGLDDNNS